MKKILFAYDGSECAEAALADLSLAGLPPLADVLLYSVAEVWLPTTEYSDIVEHTFPGWFAPELDAASVLCASAADRLRSAFPDWRVETEIEIGSAALKILRKAEHWGADLIVTGSRGHTAAGPGGLGSISLTICGEAGCTVRVARAAPRKEADEEEGERGGPRIAICVDGSASSSAAVGTVASRAWPEGTEVLLVTTQSSLGMPREAAAAARTRVRELQQREEERLAAAGLKVTSAVGEGNPRNVLVAEAEKWGADCIFVGTRGTAEHARSLLGSVSAAVVMRAHCSVEVVRRP